MKLSLESKSGAVFPIGVTTWCRVLQLATAYGWMLELTEAPRGWTGEEWDGTYISKSGQGVRASDAAALARALDGFLLDDERKILKSSTTVHGSTALWAPRHKLLVKKAADFCRQGFFRVN